jgi:hypothetical protein
MELKHVLRGADGTTLHDVITKVTPNYVQFGVEGMDPLVVIEPEGNELRVLLYGHDADEGPHDIIPLFYIHPDEDDSEERKVPLDKHNSK